MTDNFAEYVLCMNSFLNHYRGFSKTGGGSELIMFHENTDNQTFLHVDDGMNRIVVIWWFIHSKCLLGEKRGGICCS